MRPATRIRALSERYEAHNAARGADFVYGGPARVRSMRALLRDAPSRVLDLGCRDGALAAQMGFQPGTVIGVDIDFSSLRAARESGRLTPCLADLWAPVIPFRSATFDLVLAGEVLEHVPFPESLVAEIARVLTPFGSVIGSVPNTFRLKNRVLFLSGRHYETDPTHLRQFSRASLRALLESHFEEVKIKPCVGRLVAVWPAMMANDLVWCASGLRRGRGGPP